MKKLLISAVLLMVPSIVGKSSIDTVQSTNLVDTIVDAIEKGSIAEVTTNVRKLSCSERSLEEKTTALARLYAIAKAVRKNQEDNVRIGNSWIDSFTTLGGPLVVFNSFMSVLTERGMKSPLRRWAEILAGTYATYKGYKCWYQNRCIGAAQKVEEYVEDALEEVKKG